MTLDSAALVDVGADLSPDSAGLDQDGPLAWADLGPDLPGWGDVGADMRTVDATADLGDQEPDSDSDPIAGIACDKLASIYAAFLAAHRDCVSISDCKTVGGVGTCNCMATIGNASGDAISATAVSDANAYFRRERVCTQQGFKFPATCDAAPAGNLRCQAGKCAADESSCLRPRD